MGEIIRPSYLHKIVPDGVRNFYLRSTAPLALLPRHLDLDCGRQLLICCQFGRCVLYRLRQTGFSKLCIKFNQQSLCYVVNISDRMIITLLLINVNKLPLSLSDYICHTYQPSYQLIFIIRNQLVRVFHLKILNSTHGPTFPQIWDLFKQISNLEGTRLLGGT